MVLGLTHRSPSLRRPARRARRGGNSAGQAAVFLSGFAAKVSILVRDNGLETSMSRYLIDRIEATANIEVLPRTEITTLIGGPGSQLARVRWRHAIRGDETELPICHLFLFVWRRARDGVASRLRHRAGPGGLRAHGARAITGHARCRSNRASRASLPSAICCSGSAKRVGGVFGEGAAVVAQLHTVLADAPPPMPYISRGRSMTTTSSVAEDGRWSRVGPRVPAEIRMRTARTPPPLTRRKQDAPWRPLAR